MHQSLPTDHTLLSAGICRVRQDSICITFNTHKLKMQTSFLTPPFGWALFFLKGVAPPEITTLDIYKGVIPFILTQVVMLVILFSYPGLALWLPDVIGW